MCVGEGAKGRGSKLFSPLNQMSKKLVDIGGGGTGKICSDLLRNRRIFRWCEEMSRQESKKKKKNKISLLEHQLIIIP